MTPKPTNPQDKDSHRSNCCNAPTVLCKGRAWDVKTVQKGSTYYYGCTKCHKACDIAGIVTKITDEPQDKLDELEAILMRFATVSNYEFRRGELGQDPATQEVVKRNNRLYLEEAKQSIRAYIKNTVPDYSKVDRFEVIDNEGRAYAKGSIYGSPVKIKLSLQDDGRTLKVFVEEKGS